MEKKYKVFALVGPSGCGKDTILNMLLKKYNKSKAFHRIVSYTTRPKREGEQEGKNYFYTTREAMTNYLLSDQIVEMAEFNNWFYGTTLDCYDIDKVNIGIFDPTRLDILLSNKNLDVIVFYINTKDNIRLIRQLSREDNPDIDEIFRRFKTDREDFCDITDVDAKLVNLTNNTKLDLYTNVLALVHWRNHNKNR